MVLRKSHLGYGDGTQEGVSRKRRSLSICAKRDDCSLTARGQRPQEGWGRRQMENSGGGTQSRLWKRKRRDRRMRSKEKEEEGEKRGGDDSAVENSEALAEMRGAEAVMHGGALCWACNGLETSRPAQSLEIVGVRWMQILQ